eukprot:scaffold387986_cov17-Prasinocladus_malaysianus.AAC.1
MIRRVAVIVNWRAEAKVPIHASPLMMMTPFADILARTRTRYVWTLCSSQDTGHRRRLRASAEESQT